MKNRYLNFSRSRFKAGFLAILLISATAVAPAKAGWFSDTILSFFSFSADTDNKGPMIALAAVVTAGIGFALYHYLFKSKKKPDQNPTTDNQPDNAEQGEKTNSEQLNKEKETNNEETSPTTPTFICSNEEYLENATNRFSNVPGKELQITDNVSVVQYLVFNQYNKRINSDGKKVPVTGNDSCGYHALDNASHIIQYKDGKITQFPETGKISQKFGSLENSQFPGGGHQRIDIIQQRNRQATLAPIEKIIKNFINYSDNEQNREKIEKCIGDIATRLAGKTYQSGELKIDSKTINKYMLKYGKNLITDKVVTLENIDKKYVLSTAPTSNYPGYEHVFIKTEYGNEKGESLYGDELNNIIANNFDPERYSVLENMDTFNIEDSGFLWGDSKKTKNQINKLKQLVNGNKPFSHAFIINTARVIKQGKQNQDKGTYGHYFTVVAHSNGKNRTYMIADSTNKVRLYGDHHVKELITMIEGEPVAQKLVLPHEKQEQFKQEIDNLLVNKHPGEKYLDLMSLATRYKQWSGKPLPPKTTKQIEERFSN